MIKEFYHYLWGNTDLRSRIIQFLHDEPTIALFFFGKVVVVFGMRPGFTTKQIRNSWLVVMEINT